MAARANKDALASHINEVVAKKVAASETGGDFDTPRSNLTGFTGARAVHSASAHSAGCGATLATSSFVHGLLWRRTCLIAAEVMGRTHSQCVHLLLPLLAEIVGGVQASAASAPAAGVAWVSVTPAEQAPQPSAASMGAAVSRPFAAAMGAASGKPTLERQMSKCVCRGVVMSVLAA
jgi:hypothetical protein